MGTNNPETDVEKQEPIAAEDATKTAVQPNEANHVDQPKPEGAFTRFLSGPYYEVIPPQYERVVRLKSKPQATKEEGELQEAGQDYLGKLKQIVMNPVDVDDQYGLTKDELVPLPFDVPKWHAYLVDILSGVYLVAQATIVMFIAIYVENQERAWKSGGNYTRSWLPVVKALVIVYPLITLIILVSFTVDYTIRKFMYFRLLSMRILVDWKNYQPWNTVFFYYFIATWVIMNAWAIYGVAKFYNKDGNSGVDPVSFSTFIVVNLQTIQLLIYYFKLLSSESRLVSLNQIFERAPVEAQKLLEYTYVIEEEELIEECYIFALNTRRIFARRLLNIVSCCIFAKDWHDAEKNARFDIERLKRSAPNYEQVERNVDELRGELKRENDGNPEKEKKGTTQSGLEQVEATGGPACSPDQVVTHVNDGDASAGRRADDKPRELLAKIGWRPLRWMYSQCYGSLHSLHVSVMVSFPSWPFRPDSPYFRMLTLVQLLGVLGVGAIVVLGWVYSTAESSCKKSTKTCRNCLVVHERYFSSSEPLCSSFEEAIAGIVASTNGTWRNNGVLQERYCNWVCYGNFTASAQCPSIN